MQIPLQAAEKAACSIRRMSVFLIVFKKSTNKRARDLKAVAVDGSEINQPSLQKFKTHPRSLEEIIDGFLDNQTV
jgi:hypothetical protein